MARFERAIGTVLKHEGGYVNDPDDPGGETKHGISKKSYPHLNIKALTVEQAKAIYRRDFWRYDRIENQRVATKVFDTGVNMGATRSHRILQRALRNLGQQTTVDGKLGPKTLAATNRADPARLIQELRALQAERYVNIILGRPQSKKFLRGWLRRAVS